MGRHGLLKRDGRSLQAFRQAGGKLPDKKAPILQIEIFLYPVRGIVYIQKVVHAALRAVAPEQDTGNIPGILGEDDIFLPCIYGIAFHFH